MIQKSDTNLGTKDLNQIINILINGNELSKIAFFQN